jgi:hypothetical protein
MTFNPADTYRRVTRYLDTNGDGTGQKNAIDNYSSGEIFYIQPAPGEVFYIARMIVVIRDATVDAADYGALSELTNGVVMRVSDDNGVLDNLTDDVPITTNAGWAAICYDVTRAAWGTGDEFIKGRMSFFKDGPYVPLNGNRNERLEIVLSDDLTGLVSHTFMARGFIAV